jgi:hypothetical protein
MTMVQVPEIGFTNLTVTLNAIDWSDYNVPPQYTTYRYYTHPRIIDFNPDLVLVTS